jgi:zinc protease
MSRRDRSQAPSPAPVRDFVFPNVVRDALPNGLALLSVPHGELPVVTFELVVHAGGEHDTADTAGLAYLTARALEAGTRTRSADRLAWEFEKLGAELEIDVLWDYAALTVTAPADRAEAAIALLAEVVLEPAFAPEEVERLKHEQLAELLQREAEPRALANDQAVRFIFAPASPYQRPLYGLRDTVRSLTAAQVRGAHERLWRAGNAALFGVGAIDPPALRDLAARHFGAWSGSAAPADLRVAPQAATTQVHLVHRAGSVQSEIRVGHVGVPRKTPRYYALVIANSILGGAFTSRLNMNLREKHGFTYGVRSGFAFRKASGPFIIQTAVATDVTARAVEEIWQETTGLLRDGPTDEELDSARDYLSGTVPLELQTTEQIADRASEIFIFDLPTDYFALYRDELRRVTAEQALDAARAHVRPAEFVLTIVGDAHALEQDIGALQIGPVQVHEDHD